MITPQQVMQAFINNDLQTMMNAIRLVAERQPEPDVITSPAQYAAMIMHELGYQPQEELWLTTLNAHMQMIATHKMYRGTALATALSVSEIGKILCMDGAFTWIVAHNHPGSSLPIQPSDADLNTTQRLNILGTVLQMPLMDAVIVGPGQWFSFSQNNLLGGNNVRQTEAQRAFGLTRSDYRRIQRSKARQG